MASPNGITVEPIGQCSTLRRCRWWNCGVWREKDEQNLGGRGRGAAIGKDRLGVRLSPFVQYGGGIHVNKPLELFTFVITELSKLRILSARDRRAGSDPSELIAPLLSLTQ